PEVAALPSGAEEGRALRAVAPTAEAADLEPRGEDLLLASCVQVRQTGDPLVTVEEVLEVPPSLPRRRSRRHGVELLQGLLDELLDRDSNGGGLLTLGACDRPLAVLVGEVELSQSDRDDGRCDERHDDG